MWPSACMHCIVTVLGSSVSCRSRPRSSHRLRYVDRSRPCTRSFLAGSGGNADQLRSSMFKLVPSVEQGSWIIRQSVGNTPVLLGKKLKTEYHRCGMRPLCMPHQNLCGDALYR